MSIPMIIVHMQKGKTMAEYIMKSSPILESDSTPLEVVGELIRCKDCIYFNHEGRYRGESKWCSIYGREAKESDFCSWAERKEE